MRKVLIAAVLTIGCAGWAQIPVKMGPIAPSSITTQTLNTFMSFGATCNGVADDSTAWTSAMSYAATNNGVKIIFPMGKTCYFASKITISQSNVFLDCAAGWGGVIGYTPRVYPSCALSFPSGSSGIDTAAGVSMSLTMQNLWIKGGDTSANSDVGVHLTSANPTLTHNAITGFGGSGISIDSSGSASAIANQWHLEANYSGHNYGDGLTLIPGSYENTNDGKAELNTFDTNGGWGIDAESGQFGNIFEDNYILGNTSGAINGAGFQSEYILNSIEVGTGSNSQFPGTGNYILVDQAGASKSITSANNSNMILELNCASESDNLPCWHTFSWNMAPPFGSSGHYWELRNGAIDVNDFDFYDKTSGVSYMYFDPGYGVVFEQTVQAPTISKPSIPDYMDFPASGAAGTVDWRLEPNSSTSGSFDIYDVTDNVKQISAYPGVGITFGQGIFYHGTFPFPAAGGGSGYYGLWPSSDTNRWQMYNNGGTPSPVALLSDLTNFPSVGTPTLNHAACIKATGPPVIIGYCSTVVASDGSCTCN
jgi:hypothetical protein